MLFYLYFTVTIWVCSSKPDRVGAGHSTIFILGLRVLEVGLGVVISDSVVVGVGGGLNQVSGQAGRAVVRRGVVRRGRVEGRSLVFRDSRGSSNEDKSDDGLW